MAKKDYRDKLLEKGIPASYIKSKYGDRINSNEYKKIKKSYDKDKEEFYDSLPSEIKNNDAIMSQLESQPFDMQKMAMDSYNIQVENNEDKARKMDQAFDMAVTQADPYWKQIIRIAQDETIRTFDEAKGDYEASALRIERRRTELQEDVSSNRERLSLDEQSQLARIDRGYEQQSQNVAMAAADAGVTFGTGALARAGKQEVVEEETADIVESTKREYGQQIEDLNIRAQRGETDAAEQLTELESTYGSRVQEIGRASETYLGSERTAGLDLEGYKDLGDIVGGIEEDKIKDTQVRKETLFNELNQSSLNFDFF